MPKKRKVFKMSKKIYVGNMPYSTTEDQLSELFAQYGSVENVNIIKDRFTDRPRGFAFVEMEDGDAAAAAIEALNDQEFSGRRLRVSEAHEKRPRQGGPRE